MDLTEGALLASKYRLLRRLGAGGMGEVWLARVEGPAGFEKQVAIKIASPSLAEDPEFVEMFLAEARLSAQLNHANIAQIHDLGRSDDAYFIAMELVAGKDLRQTVFALRKKQQRLPVAAACFVVSELCQALDYAHRKLDASGHELLIVHRDVSPPNCLLSFAGDVKLIDFGIAKVASRASSTKLGMIKGKLGYMSPEQAEGKPLDRRSDVFALGVVLYELLAGARLFQGDSDIETLEKVRNPKIPELNAKDTHIPAALEVIVRKALARDPAGRHAWASLLHADLQPFLVAAFVPFGRTQLAALMVEAFGADPSQPAAASPLATPAPTPAATPARRTPARPRAAPKPEPEPVAPVPEAAPARPAGRQRSVWIAAGVLFVFGGVVAGALAARSTPVPPPPPVVALQLPEVVPVAVPAPVAVPVAEAPVLGAGALVAEVPAAAPAKRAPPKAVQRAPKPLVEARGTEWGDLTVRSNETADVMLDGKRIGSAPMERQRVRAGEHSLRIDCLLADGRHQGTARSVEIFPYSEVTVTNTCKVTKTITR